MSETTNQTQSTKKEIETLLSQLDGIGLLAALEVFKRANIADGIKIGEKRGNTALNSVYMGGKSAADLRAMAREHLASVGKDGKPISKTNGQNV